MKVHRDADRRAAKRQWINPDVIHRVRRIHPKGKGFAMECVGMGGAGPCSPAISVTGIACWTARGNRAGGGGDGGPVRGGLWGECTETGVVHVNVSGVAGTGTAVGAKGNADRLADVGNRRDVARRQLRPIPAALIARLGKRHADVVKSQAEVERCRPTSQIGIGLRPHGSGDRFTGGSHRVAALLGK